MSIHVSLFSCLILLPTLLFGNEPSTIKSGRTGTFTFSGPAHIHLKLHCTQESGLGFGTDTEVVVPSEYTLTSPHRYQSCEVQVLSLAPGEKPILVSYSEKDRDAAGAVNEAPIFSDISIKPELLAITKLNLKEQP